MARVLRSILQEMWEFYLEGVWLWRISGGYSQEMRGSVMHFQQFYQMRIIRITLLKLQALKLS